MSEAIGTILIALPRLLLVGGAASWLVLGSSVAGLFALGAAAYLWIDFWLRAIRFKRARESNGSSGSLVTDPSAPSRFGARILYRGPRHPGKLAQRFDADLARRPFLVMAALFGSISLVLASIGLIGGLEWPDALGFALSMTLFGTLVGGGVVWLAEAKPDSSHALTRAIEQEGIKGGPPPF